MSGNRAMEELTLLVAAAGQGSRLGLGPKAFLRLGDKSLLEWVVAVGSRVADEVVVAVPPGCVARARRELVAFRRDGFVQGTLARNRALMPSNPQAYQTGLLRDALRMAAENGLEHQTLWELIVDFGTPVFVVEGEQDNIKVTDQGDWDHLQKVIFPRWSAVNNKRNRE